MNPTRRTLLRSVPGTAVALTTVGASTLVTASDEHTDTRSCDGDEHRASITVADETAVVDGQLLTPTPCHDPVLEDADHDDTTLSVTIGTERDDQDLCTQVIDCAVYEEPVRTPETTGLTDVAVRHDGAGEETLALEAVVDSRERNCNRPRHEASTVENRSSRANVVRLTGHVVAPTPCHEVVFETIDYDGEDLSVTLGLNSTLEDGEACIQVVTCFAYSATIRLPDGASPSDVTVTHNDSSWAH